MRNRVDGNMEKRDRVNENKVRNGMNLGVFGLREIGKREMKKAFVNRFFIHNGLWFVKNVYGF